ncbi:M-phase phosphoprotein 8-like [Oppia nitens]|uniref:M-phase phosphoprotein 8-like n=1 Tax=Oppia nitens TaxID=1686743 RepID=UPI0023DB9DCB|nr:M-phase phosphoprotein 8-like [Oppia nitens]
MDNIISKPCNNKIINNNSDVHNSSVTEAKDDIYEVQEIVGMKTEEDDTTVFRVRWKGYGPQSDTWEPESNLQTVWKMVEKYKNKMNNKMSLLSTNNKRRGRPSTTCSNTSNNSTDNSQSKKHSSLHIVQQKQQQQQQQQSLLSKSIKKHKTTLKLNIKLNNTTNEKTIVMKKIHKKRLKYCFTTEKTKNTFWKDLEEGKIDVFKEDLYSRVKSRASSRGNSSDNSPKQSNSSSPNSLKEWADNDSNDMIDETKNINNEEKDDTNKDCLLNTNLKENLYKSNDLMIAIKKCDKELVKSLMDNGSDINCKFINNDEFTPLMMCCEDNNIEMTEFLLNNGALKDIQNLNGDTALIIACRKGFKEIIKLLLYNGSNFAIINNIGINALRITRYSGQQSVQKLLFDYISRLALSLEEQVMNILCNTATIVNALFPIQCYSMSESNQFRLSFEFDLNIDCQQKPGVGYILFAANTSITENDIKCRFFGTDVIEEVVLNGRVQKPLTEGSQYVFSFLPLVRGTNELVMKTIDNIDNHLKLVVCAYEIKLIDNELIDNNNCDFDKHN